MLVYQSNWWLNLLLLYLPLQVRERIVRGWREQANLGAAFEGTSLKFVVCESTLTTVLLLLAHPSMKRPGSAAAAVASRPP